VLQATRFLLPPNAADPLNGAAGAIPGCAIHFGLEPDGDEHMQDTFRPSHVSYLARQGGEDIDAQLANAHSTLQRAERGRIEEN
jgi:hypothetical protein